MTSPIPVLESERLALRGHRPEDFANCVALRGDPEVTRYIGGRPLTSEEVWVRLLRYAGHWIWLGYGYWVVEEKSLGKLVGELGYANLQRDIQPTIPLPTNHLHHRPGQCAPNPYRREMWVHRIPPRRLQGQPIIVFTR
jgi:RimJ/RimL family protein N-acetyltransferase